MTEFQFNGVKVTEEEMIELMQQSQDYMVQQEAEIRKAYGVSDETASAILYLRGRSRYTEEKEAELVRRDIEGNPIPLGKVLRGEF